MSKRIAGHSLQNEGAPFILDEQGRPARLWRAYGGVGGEGRGACSCGALSDEVLPSAYKRKAWHREHKAEIGLA